MLVRLLGGLGLPNHARDSLAKDLLFILDLHGCPLVPYFLILHHDLDYAANETYRFFRDQLRLCI